MAGSIQLINNFRPKLLPQCTLPLKSGRALTCFCRKFRPQLLRDRKRNSALGKKILLQYFCQIDHVNQQPEETYQRTCRGPIYILLASEFELQTLELREWYHILRPSRCWHFYKCVFGLGWLLSAPSSLQPKLGLQINHPYFLIYKIGNLLPYWHIVFKSTLSLYS